MAQRAALHLRTSSVNGRMDSTRSRLECNQRSLLVQMEMPWKVMRFYAGIFDDKECTTLSTRTEKNILT